ncbi:MAG TPA: MBL fold metallo-hydrolase [Gemmatirosa sp.]
MSAQLSQTAQIDIPPHAEIVDAPVVAVRPADAPPLALPARPGGRQPLTVTRIAHASVLIDFAGKAVLTDPWFTETPEYHQGEALGLGVDGLPRLTAVVASHAHYDHFDIEHFARYPHLDVPLLVGFPDMVERARNAGFTDVRQIHPGETQVVDGVSITALPGAHVVPEITFLLAAGGNTVYFGGDTLLTPDVRAIAVRGPVDVALLPVNGLLVGGEPAVSSAEEAAVFAGMLQAAVAIPTHYRFFGGPKTEAHLLTYNGTPFRFLNSLRRTAPDTVGRVLEPGQRQRFT